MSSRYAPASVSILKLDRAALVDADVGREALDVGVAAIRERPRSRTVCPACSSRPRSRSPDCAHDACAAGAIARAPAIAAPTRVARPASRRSPGFMAMRGLRIAWAASCPARLPQWVGFEWNADNPQPPASRRPRRRRDRPGRASRGRHARPATASCTRSATAPGDLLEPMAAIHRPARTFADYDAMLADPELDAVIVAIADQFHVAAALKALDAGKHVLVEKPLGTSADEARAAAAPGSRPPGSVAPGRHDAPLRRGRRLRARLHPRRARRR